MANKGLTSKKTRTPSTAKKELDAILKYAPDLEKIEAKVREKGLSAVEKESLQKALDKYKKYNGSQAQIAVAVCQAVLNASKEAEAKAAKRSKAKYRSVSKVLGSFGGAEGKDKPFEQPEQDHELTRAFLKANDNKPLTKLKVYTKGTIQTISAISDCITVGRVLVASLAMLGFTVIFPGNKASQRADAAPQVAPTTQTVKYEKKTPFVRKATADEVKQLGLDPAAADRTLVYYPGAEKAPTVKDFGKSLEKMNIGGQKKLANNNEALERS